MDRDWIMACVSVRFERVFFRPLEAWRRFRTPARARQRAKTSTEFQLHVLHGDRLNRLKAWTRMCHETPDCGPRRRELERRLSIERRLCRESELAIAFKAIETALDTACDVMIVKKRALDRMEEQR